MDNTRNALAELAKFLKEESKVPKSKEFKARAIASCGEDSWKRYLAKKNKMLTASRIVTELAKVEDWTNDYGSDEPRSYSSVSAIKECRAIAEEGADE